MIDDLAYVRNLKKFARSDLGLADLPELEKEVYGVNDRASAIILGAMVEEALTAYLKKKIRNDLNSDDKRYLFDYEGPLGTFSSKIALAYAFNLIGPIVRNDLDHIRVLRNEFAHSRKSFGFATSEVITVCDHLKIPDVLGSYVPTTWLPSPTQARRRFISACHSLAYRMIVAREGPREGDTAFPDDNPVP